MPYDQVISNADDVVLGFNSAFAAWSGSYPDNWADWAGGAPIRETAIMRHAGGNAARMTAAGANRGILCNRPFTTTPLPTGTFLSGSADFYLVSRTSGLPGILVRLFTDAAITTYVDTFVQPPLTTTGGWQRVPWSARVGAGQKIYGVRIYAMASFTAMPGGSFTGEVIFGDIRFALCDATTDNKAVAIAADGSLSGAGGGQVTITGLGYTGDLNATYGATAAQVAAISAAQADADAAQATADGKIDSFYQTAAPTGTVGDLWFDTDDGNKQYLRRFRDR